MERGESPRILIAEGVAEEWYGRDPFVDEQIEGISSNLLMSPLGTTDGHNLMRDGTFAISMPVDKWVPLSPLFVKDLTGRAVYVGFGPDRKGNSEWAQYRPLMNDDGEIAEEDYNPFVPLCVFPRFCRDVSVMEGQELLDRTFLTKFRSLEMSMGFNGMLSGADPEDPLVCATYLGANLYPYKLRLDTFYVDGWKLPQTQMVYARGEHEGVNAISAIKLGEQFMAHWQGRSAGIRYEDWLDGIGDEGVAQLYRGGCTVIPTFDACNGYHVVGPNFELEDYWPGRAVLGLHDVVEQRADKAPQGTILEVIEPGFVTCTKVRPAKVIVSDGSGYVSPNAADPEPLLPNLHLPHTRVIASWGATWVPTHPEHFEVPALWGWELNTGRFLQLGGPLWDPLHYFYESVDEVLGAFEANPVSDDNPLVLVPEHMEHRFYPVIPMAGFDTFSRSEYLRRNEKGVGIQSCIKRVSMESFAAGLGYHPLPAEFEFELDTFWFPEFHPLNREHGDTPEDVLLMPVIRPTVTMAVFVPSVDVPEEAEWFRDETRLFTPVDDPVANYPELSRYLFNDLDIDSVVSLCPVPYLNDPGDKLPLPAPGWWLDDDNEQMDGPLALQEILSNVHDPLWDMRQSGVELVQFRHLVYRTNLPLYMMAWWNGWDVNDLQEGFMAWERGDGGGDENAPPPPMDEYPE